MSDISIFEIDGSEPLPICRMQREWLIDTYKLLPSIAHWFFSDDAHSSQAIKHVRECEKCREWIHRVIPKDVLRRQSRLVRYCCAGMFVAVEETGPHGKRKIDFGISRGEPYWTIGGPHGHISYCPWCGKKLPDKPYISEK